MLAGLSVTTFVTLSLQETAVKGRQDNGKG